MEDTETKFATRNQVFLTFGLIFLAGAALGAVVTSVYFFHLSEVRAEKPAAIHGVGVGASRTIGI